MSTSCLGQQGLVVRGDGHRKVAVSSSCPPLCLAGPLDGHWVWLLHPSLFLQSGMQQDGQRDMSLGL